MWGWPLVPMPVYDVILFNTAPVPGPPAPSVNPGPPPAPVPASLSPASPAIPAAATLITPPGPPRLAFEARDGNADDSGDGGARNVGALAAERAAPPTVLPRSALAPGGATGAAAAAGAYDPALRGFTRVRGPRPSPGQPAPEHEHERPHT